MLRAVWFTGVRARTMLPANPEWHDWQVLDSEDLRRPQRPILRTLAAGTKHLDDKIKYFTYGGVGPDAETAERIASLLRPRFELATVAGDRRRARESQLISFIEEQFLALDAIGDNRSVLFSGPAGSGKTFLAMESARREMATGKQGRLAVLQPLPRQAPRSDMADLEGSRSAPSTRSCSVSLGSTRAPDNPTPEFWSEELPERAMEALIDGGEALTSDFLIVDEIQDIATEPYLDVLDLMVDGGLKDGRAAPVRGLRASGDLRERDGRERLRAPRAPHLTSHKLMQNCRNLPRIGYQVNLLSHLQPGYQQFRRLDDGVDPTFRQYQAGQDQSALLVAAIRGLKDEGFELNEIVVLSPQRDGSTAATTTDPWLRQILKPADGLPRPPGTSAVRDHPRLQRTGSTGGHRHRP